MKILAIGILTSNMEASTSLQPDTILSPASIRDVLPSDEPQVEDEENKDLLRVYPKQCATDLLLLLSPDDRMFDSVSPINSSEQSSQISIPFSDVVLEEGVRKACVGDRILVDEEAMAFSSEFRKALLESRNEESKECDQYFVWT
jgi:hypothetical protein